MANEADICNMSLANLLLDATIVSISPPDGSVEAEQCSRFYPLSRDEVLDRHNWRFATKRSALALLDVDVPTSWAYAYALPSDCIRVISAIPAEPASDGNVVDYVQEVTSDGVPVIYTNEEDAYIRYIYRVTNVNIFSPLFVTTLSWRISSHLIGPLVRGDRAMRKDAMDQYEMFLAHAATQDSRAMRWKPDDTPAGIKARA